MAKRKQPLKAPFPYFGGKSRVASVVWDYLGDVDNFIEPFCGSAAVLLARPHTPKIETINDADSYCANFWRATSTAPQLVAEWADWPVNEADLHARHRWLVLSGYAAEFRKRMRTEPGYFDARIAGWWCWGLCCWIGSGWCQTPESSDWDQMPFLSSCEQGINVKGQDARKPRIDGGESQYGHGVHAKGQLPLIGDPPRGVHRAGESSAEWSDHRPQLADAYSRGRGVHGNDNAGTCANRLAWLCDWFGRLRDRLRTVRVCCGDWLRVCDSESVTTRLGTTGIFFDPPYGAGADRNPNLYAVDCLEVAAKVRAYCLERGSDPKMRIVLAGYAEEGHEVLEQHGWEVYSWQAAGGYGNRSAKGKENAKKERLWASPNCNVGISLFDGLDSD